MGTLWFDTFAQRQAAARRLRDAGVKGLKQMKDMNRVGTGQPAFLVASSDWSTAAMRAAIERRNSGLMGKLRAHACGEGRKPAGKLTDRAMRYRANAPACVEHLGPRVCSLCPSKRNIGVHHKDGDESNGAPHNLAWACKSCNARVAVLQKRWGVGRRVNPSKRPPKAGVMTLGKYGALMREMRGDGPTSKSAYDTIMSLSPAVRSQFNRELWQVRRERYGPSGRQQSFWDAEVPF